MSDTEQYIDDMFEHFRLTADSDHRAAATLTLACVLASINLAREIENGLQDAKLGVHVTGDIKTS